MEDILYGDERWFNLSDYDNEEWTDIKGFEGYYQISNYGRVKSVGRTYKAGYLTIHRADFILKLSMSKQSYLRAHLLKDRRRYIMSVHRLVAFHFLDNSNCYPIVNHKNENPKNNRVENLEWCTAKYNANYGSAKKRRVANFISNNSKSICQYDKNGVLIKEYSSIKNVTNKTGFDRHSISSVCNGRHYTGYGYIWRYKGDPFDKYPINYDKHKKSGKNGRAVVKYDLCGNIVKIYKGGLKELLDDFKNFYSIKTCLNGFSKTAYGFIWRYEGQDPPQPIVKRKIVKYSLQGIEISRYNSVAEAVRDMGYGSTSAIISNLKKETHKSYNYIWQYDDEEPPKPIVLYLIEQQSKDGERVALFESVRKATTSIGAKTTSSIYLCLNGKKKFAYGYKWKYVTC